MNTDNYLNTINNTKDLLTELLNDPNHGKLTFMGIHGLDNLTITSPQQLDDLISGTVLAIGRSEWMAIAPLEGDRRYWQNFSSPRVATSEALYLRALKASNGLTYCHAGL